MACRAALARVEANLLKDHLNHCIEGAIVSGPTEDGLFSEESAMNSDVIAQALLDASEDDNVRAIVFRVSSPGGSVVASDQILAALRTADQRMARAAQPRLARVRTAITRDIDRIKAGNVTDIPGLLARLDDLVRQADDLPVANAVPVAGAPVRKAAASEPQPLWWQRGLSVLREEARALVRVSRIENPEAVLMSPEQAFFVRENFKLKLLNARLGLLARQTESARADLAAASATLNRYFDPSARRTQAAAGLLQQVQAQARAVELPRIDDTLAALATAGAGR